MTVRERVIASRLVEKIDEHSEYAKQIGLSYVLAVAKTNGLAGKVAQKKEKNKI